MVEKAVELPVRRANGVFVAPHPVVALDGARGVVAQCGPEVFSIERTRLGHFQIGHRHQGREHVESAAESIPGAVDDFALRPMNRRRQVRAAFADAVLAGFEGKIAAVLGRAVVAGEDNDGVVAQAELVQFGEDGAHVLIQCLHHRGVAALRFVGDLRIHVFEVGILRLQGCMHDMKRHIAEERPRFIVANEFPRALHDEVLCIACILRAELAVVPPAHRPLAADGAPREVVRAAAVIDPRLIETVLIYPETALEFLVRHCLECLRISRAILGGVRVIAVVPFAEDAGAIAVRLEAFGNGGLGLLQFAADLRPGADAKRMPPREQHRAGRRAHAAPHEVAQFDSLLEKPVNLRRRNAAAAVRTDVAPAEIIGQEINDIRLRRFGGMGDTEGG